MAHGLAGERGAMRNDELLAAPAGERRVLGDVADPLHVGGGQHRQHAGHRLRRLGIDRTDIGKGVRRAHEIGIGLAGQRGVRRVTSEPAHQRIILQAWLMLRAAINGLCIHNGFQCRGGAVRGHGYNRKEGADGSPFRTAATPARHAPKAQVACGFALSSCGITAGRPSYLFSIAARTRATVSGSVRETCSTKAATCSPESGSTSILSLSASAR